MKKLKFWLFILLELSGPLCGLVMAICFLAMIITGNEHSIFGRIFGIGLNYVMPIYIVWFVLSGLYSLNLLAKKNK